MNFIVSSATLLRHLQNISGVLNSSNTLPILDNFKFSIKGNKLEICATDLETTMITKVEVQSEEDGSVAVPAKMVLEVLKSLPDQPCTFKVNGDNHKIEISYDNGRAEMSGFNGAEFPKLPKIENQSTIKISGEIVSNAINRTLFAAGNDELRCLVFIVSFLTTKLFSLLRMRTNWFDTKEMMPNLLTAQTLFYRKNH